VRITREWSQKKSGAMPRESDDDDDMPPDEDGDDGNFEAEPQLDTSMKHAIIVDGLPLVDKAKHDKLIGVIRKFFSQVGTLKEGSPDMPVDANGKSQGCVRAAGWLAVADGAPCAARQ
jgi:hypothetical protein